VIVALRRGPVMGRGRGAPVCDAGPNGGVEGGVGGGVSGIGAGAGAGGAGCAGAVCGTVGTADTGGCKRMERSR
jgi:hypothetical protein